MTIWHKQENKELVLQPNNSFMSQVKNFHNHFICWEKAFTSCFYISSMLWSATH